MRDQSLTSQLEEEDPRLNSAPIWRCSACGALVHPVDPERPAAFCSRCRCITDTIEDGAQ